MPQKKYFFKTPVIISLTCLLIFEPFFAYGAPLQPDGSTSTTIDKARNNVPIVNIANPGASGLSHNKFTQYNVNKEGLILNNAKTSTVNTQLDGYIYGNSQLTNNAKLILNEVTSTSRSVLNGYTEIAGSAADLVIANPNGLSINGAGFINTNNVTLTTGRPVIASGELKSLNITGGDIAIMGKGLNTQSQSSTSIYTQYLKLNAKLYAQNLDIKLGSNIINYQDKSAASNGTANAHTVLLDTSALGGMYAGRISLVGTDKGLGVNLPPEVLASSGNISINNNGTIVLQKLSAKQLVNIQSANDIVLNNNLYSGMDITLGAAHTLTINGGVTAAKHGITINSNQLINQANIIAGLNADNTRNTTGTASITSSVVTNNGQIQSAGDLNVMADSLDNGNTIIANNQLRVDATTRLNNHGTLHANQNSRITTAALTNSKNITATNQLDITTAQLTSTGGEISATDVNINVVNLNAAATNVLAVNDLDLNVTGEVTNAGTASHMQAGNNIYLLNATSLTNQGLIAAGNDNRINVSQSIHNDGTLSANKALFLTARDVTNTKQISSNGTLSIQATNSINNVNALISALGDTIIRGASLNNTHANLLSGKNHDIVISGVLTNTQGVIKSNQNSTINVASLDNVNGSVEAVGNLTLQAADIALTNSTLYAGNDFSLSLNALNNISSSSMGAGNNLTINTVNTITNSADILANGHITLITQGRLINNKVISSAGSLSIQASGLDNTATGTLSGGMDTSRLDINGAINNQSRISAVGNLDVNGANVVNSGFFNAGNNLTMTSTNLTNNQTLFAGNNMKLYTSGTLRNNPNTNIFAMNNLTMATNAGLGKTASIVNDQANIEAYNGNLDIYAHSLINRTKPPVIQGTYVPTVPAVPAHWIVSPWQMVLAKPAIPEHIVGGKRLPTVTKTNGCGSNCKNVITTTVDTMVLTSSTAPATINAGGKMSLNAENITNQYSLISAGGNIQLAAKGVDNQPKSILKVTTVSTKMYVDKRSCDAFGKWFCSHSMVYLGKKVSTSKQITNTVAATIQAGGSITGNASKVKNDNIRAHQTISASTSQTANTATTANKQATNTIPVTGGNVPAVATLFNPLNQPVIQLPKGTNGLFVVPPDPNSQYLIETNSALTVYNNFISSNYMLQHLKFSPDRTIKRVGDDFYENKLVRDSIVAQTSRHFLRRDITSDYAQYKYLMDNALKAQAGLHLAPGVALTATQVAALNNDIVWLTEQQVAGQKVLVPVVYIVNAHDYKIEGGKIIAGNNIDLAVNKLQNSGLLEAGNNLAVTAVDSVINKNGSIRAGGDLSLRAKNNIENISADMAARNITLVASNGSIINRRYTEEQSLAGGRDRKTVTGKAGNIAATDNLALTAGKTVAIKGSQLEGGNISLNAQQVAIGTTVKTSNFAAEAEGISLKQQSTTHLGSTVEGGNIAINTSGATSVSGSRVKAKDKLAIHAAQIDALAVNNSRYEENRTTSSGFLSHQSTTTRHATSTHIGSQLSGGNVALNSRKDNINITSSAVSADDTLALNSAKNITIQAGFDGTMDETHTKKSGWFSGGKIFSKSEDLAGKLNKTAVKSNLSGKHVSLNAGKDIALKGVDIAASQNLDGKAQNITVANTNNEEKTWSRQSKMSVGLGDVGKMLTHPDKLIKYKDGKFSVTLGRAEISKADKTTTTTTVVGSSLEAGNINLVADSKDSDQGNVSIKGSHLTANNGVSLTASNNVTIKEAKNTEKTASKDMKGTAELNLTAKNEYVQINYAVQAAKQAKNQLVQSKQSYDHYKQDLTKQRARLLKLKADLANGKTGIEQADVNGMQGLIDNLKGDDAFYKANIALAAANLASKTTAVASQMAKAAQSSKTYGLSASVELDIDALVKKFNAYKEHSVGSNVTANNINININAGSTATVHGSNLNASNQIDIAANDTNILASQDVNTSSNSSNHAHLNINYGMYGGAGNNVSVSADRSKGENRGITNTNSQLVANNIHINTHETTTIAGANVLASDSLSIKSKNLDISSVQDSRNSRSHSRGFSISGGSEGISGAGVNGGMSHSREKRTVLTSVTGNHVNIDTKENTTLKGATIAAVDKNGNDNGNLNLNLNLKTGAIEVSSLNNTRNNKSMSLGINAGVANQQQRDRANNKSTLSSVSIDFANDRTNSKTKTLGTIGKGSIQVASVDKSNTKMLNRDVKNNTVDIYNISSHKGLEGTVDTRVFTRKGRKQIKKEFKGFGKNMQIVAEGLPEANNGNAIIAMIGKGLDKISAATGGVIPSNGLNGGLLGNTPVMVGDKDINHKIIQVASANSKYVQANPDLFVPIEKSDYFKSASPENQKAILEKSKETRLYVSKEPISIDVANATYQNFTNGMLNTIGDAMKNGMDQTSSDKEGAPIVFTVNYNPTHGLVGDGLESAVDKVGGTTGIARQTGKFINNVTTARGKNGSNFTAHSQGNLLTIQGVEYQRTHGGFKNKEYFSNPNASDTEKNKGTPTFAGYGSPVNTEDMSKTLNKVDFKNLGIVTHPGDFVGEGLGGNKGKNGRMSAGEQVKSIVDVPKLFKGDSPHSTYKCSENPNAKCGDRP